MDNKKCASAQAILLAILALTGCLSATATYDGAHNIRETAADSETQRSAPAGLNVIYLKDGSEIRGKIISQDRNTIVVKTNFGTVNVSKDNIKSIKYK